MQTMQREGETDARRERERESICLYLFLLLLEYLPSNIISFEIIGTLALNFGPVPPLADEERINHPC